MDFTENCILSNTFQDKSNISFAKDVVSSLGCLVRKADNAKSEDGLQHAPFTLLPSPFSRKCFEEALFIQEEIQLALHKIAHDHSFLRDCLQSVIKVDEYTRRLWNIYDTVFKEGYQQPICLGVIRSDYMLHTTGSLDFCNQYNKMVSQVYLKQVEMNTISASFGGLSQNLQKYHSLIAGKSFGPGGVERIPPNTSCDCLAEGLVTAWSSYGNEKANILFLVYDVERNIYDHRHLEISVIKFKPQIQIIRRSMLYLNDHLKLDADKKLWVDGLEIAVVYQRCLYAPSDFESEDSWRCRLMMERSRAILCPNAGYHLAGTKKVQQVLSRPGVLERFVTNAEMREKIRNTFVRMFSLEKNRDGDQAIDEAIKEPDRFVLKPQREGGGNNIYGKHVATKLKELKGTDKRLSYILMERISPMVIRNVPIVANCDVHPELSSMVSELGVYGVFVGSEKNVILNKQGGYLLRTKKVGTDEGGVATGYSVLDTPYLID